MRYAVVLKTLRDHLEGLFPRSCPHCARQFGSLESYLRGTEPLCSVVSIDADGADWTPAEPIGGLAFASCACGTTLGLSTEGMLLPQQWALLNWIQIETQVRNKTPAVLVSELRDELRKQVLSEAGGEGA